MQIELVAKMNYWIGPNPTLIMRKNPWPKKVEEQGTPNTTETQRMTQTIVQMMGIEKLHLGSQHTPIRAHQGREFGKNAQRPTSKKWGDDITSS